MNAIFIDSLRRSVSKCEFMNLRDLQELVGGSIEIAPVMLPGDDTMFVNEDGMRLGGGFFQVEGSPHPFVGQAVIVGPEWTKGDEWGNHDPASTVASAHAIVRFLTRDQADAWGKANASEPASTITSFDGRGLVETRVIERWGSMIAEVPRMPGQASEQAARPAAGLEAAAGTRAGHIAWCKARALGHVGRGDFEVAFAGFIADLDKHSQTCAHIGISLGMALRRSKSLATGAELRAWINGCN